MQTRILAIALTLSLCGSAAAVLADSRLEYKVTEGTGSTLQTILIGHGKIRAETDKTSTAILDPGSGAMIILDHDKRTFTRIGKAEIEQIVTALADMTKQMEQTLAGMPPEMREKMKGMMGNMPGMSAESLPTIVDTGERATVAGHACRIYRTQVQGRVTAETCMADASVLQISASDSATLAAAMKMSQELTDKLAKGPAGRFASASPFRSGLVPLRQTDIAANGTRKTSEFTGVSTSALAADLFTVPTNYKEQKIEIPKIGR